MYINNSKKQHTNQKKFVGREINIAMTNKKEARI